MRNLRFLSNSSLNAMAIASVAIGLTACGGDGGNDESSLSQRSAADACAALNNRSFGEAMSSTTTMKAATATMPEYCEVAATIKGSKINFAVRLPSTWNGKTRMGAIGGWQGAIAPADANSLSKGYVDYATDSGHSAAGPRAAFDADWAVNDNEALANFASLSYERVARSTRALVEFRYGKKPERSYFEGCSGGGRVAAQMARRFPALFDGVISGAGVSSFVGAGLQMQRGAKAIALPGAAFTPGKLATLASAVRGACDKLDGVEDGIVSNPRACNFDPEVLSCTGVDSDNCLTPAQLNVVKEVTSDTVLANGFLIGKGARLDGHEDDPANWSNWINILPDRTPATSNQREFAKSTVKVLTRDLNADVLAYEPNRDVANIMNLSALLDALPADLREFSASGGKIILFTGTADVPVPFEGIVSYYETAVAGLGGAAKAEDSLKLFVVPGGNHCTGGAGATTFDYLAALDDWVTKNVPPETKVASKVVNGAVAFTRPMCAYPNYPRYTGSGDANQASNFTCVPY